MTKRTRSSKKSTQRNLAVRLGELEIAQLVRHLTEEEPAYIFKNALTQDATYQSLLVKQRREIHRHVAHAYEAQYGDQCLDNYAGILSQHYAEAGDDAKTLEYAMRAGDFSARLYANTEAVAFFTLALAAAQRINAPSSVVQELYLKRGRAFELLSHFDDAARNYDEMQEAARQRGDRAFELTAWMARATIRAIPGSARDADQAHVLAIEALGLAHELGDRKAEAKIYWILLLADIYSGGNNVEAIENGEQSLAIARELNLHEQIAYSLNDLFVAYAYRGDLDKARSVRLEAAQFWRALDNKPMLAENITGMGIFHYLLGEYDEAMTTAREGYQLSQEIGNLGSQGFSGLVLALTYVQLGEFTNALHSLDDAVPIVDLGGLEGNGMSVLGLRAWVYACAGDAARAREFLREALKRRTVQVPYQRIYLYALSTRIELLAGNVAEAGRIINEGAVVPNADQFVRMFPPAAHIVYLACSELALAQGDYAHALAMLDELLVHLQQRRTRADRALVLWHKGQALVGMNRRDEASQVLSEALAEAEAMRERRAWWHILVALSENEVQRGNRAGAETFHQQARVVVEYIAAHTPSSLRESFLNLSDVRNVMDTKELGR